jgi:hypothetical protein
MGKRLLALAPSVLAALAGFAMLALVLQRGVDVPFSDEWDWTDLIYAAHTHQLTFEWLWYPHNEHRIFIPNLLVLGLDRLGGWDIVRAQVVSVAMVVLTQLIAWVLICRTVPQARRGATFFVATALLFGLAQHENFYWGFQIAWFLCNLCLAAAVLALTAPRAGPGALALAIAAGVAGSVSSSQGLVIWPAGLAALWLAGGRRRDVLVWTAAAIVTVVAVRANAPTGDPAIHGSLAHAADFVRYVLVYLGTPLTHSRGPDAGVVSGIVLCGWLAALAAASAMLPAAARVRTAPWFAFALYAVLCGFVTAYGRAGYGLGQAASSRYTTIATLAWLGALALTAVLVSGKLRPLPYLCAGAVLVFSLIETRDGNAIWLAHAQQLRDARYQLGAVNLSALTPLYPNPRQEVLELHRMFEMRDGLFNAPR